jgi:hypothetical protein
VSRLFSSLQGSSRIRIGFLDVGNMGQPMAGRLLDGGPELIGGEAEIVCQ